MLIEIRKAGFVNKGAHLMLLSLLKELNSQYPNADFAMETNYSPAPYEKRALYGFYQKPQLWRKGIQFGVLANFIPQKIRKMFGIVLDKELDLVIDAAGFAYGDQWGEKKLLELANSCKRWKKHNVKIILMPQALGPFKTPKMLKAVQSVARNADLIFARDRLSYQYMIDAVGERENLKMYADFTNLIEGQSSSVYDPENQRFGLIPNHQMLKMTSSANGDAHINFMVNTSLYLIEKECKPFLLVHELVSDGQVAKRINEILVSKGIKSLPIIIEQDPLKIKGIVSQCDATIGSRFHGLVSALSEGVPSLATGWSHKYEMLFEDYSFPEGVLDVHCTESEMREKIDLLIKKESNLQLRSSLNEKSRILKAKSREMWLEIFEKIEK